MSAHPLNENLWKRGWHDAISYWKSWPFIIFNGVACPMVAGLIDWYWGLILFGLAVFFVWFGATGAAPIRQRNEARRKVLELESKKEDAIRNKRIANEVGILIIEGTEVRKAFNNVDSFGKYWPIDEFKSWREHGSQVFNEFGLNSEYVLWFKDVYIDISNSILSDYKNACQAGLDRLEKILQEFSK